MTQYDAAGRQENNARRFLDLIRRSRRGKFKLYVGMIAGVGKTFRMLQDTKEMRLAGTDVQIGYVETHGRTDTEAALKGLPVIPRKRIFYKGKELEEMDLDAILQIRPEIVIVDELAHSNVAGSRNDKRWQDVADLLDAGINVLSAVNIQHIESLNDEVRGITGVEVRERVPDRVLQEADEVVNIDLAAEELIGRLKAGKIYGKDKVQQALDHFFRVENILRLRELALKEVAFRVGKKVESEAPSGAGRSVRPGRVLVCVSSNGETQQAILRKAARVAACCDGELYALYVQTAPERADRIPLAAWRHLADNLELAVQLGAVVRKAVADDIGEAIIETCRRERIATLCMGQPDFGFPGIWLRARRYGKFLRALKEMNIDLIIFG